MTTSDWPAPRAALDAARALLRGRLDAGVVAIACDSDVDGLTSAVLAERAIDRLGGTSRTFVVGRGEHAFTPSYLARVAAAAPALLVVVDMGSGRGGFVPGVPTIVVDHHKPAGFPDDAVVVSAFGHAPVATSGVLTHELLRPLVDVDDLAWLAVLSATADLGSTDDFPHLAAAAKGAGKTATAKAVSLLNAARRASTFRGDVALAVLRAACDPSDIAAHRVPGVDVLEACRQEVQSELARVSVTPPKFGARREPGGHVALLRFSSPAQIHPVVATKWAGRLRRSVVIAANDGYLPGVVSFSVRCGDKGVDLVDFVRALGLDAGGHPQATGGRVPPADFARVLAQLGFEEAVDAAR